MAKKETLKDKNGALIHPITEISAVNELETILDRKQEIITEVNVSIDETTGTPSGTATIHGGEMDLLFSGLKGQPGSTGATPRLSIGTVETAPSGSSARATITGTVEAPVLNLVIPQGTQGNTGSSVAYPYELVNNRTTDDATKGLSAAEGKRLGDDINLIDEKVGTPESKFQVLNEQFTLGSFDVTGSTVSPTPTASTTISYIKVRVTAGDQFKIHGYGGTTYRLWSFIDSTNNILSVADAGVDARTTPVQITAPSGAIYLIVQTQRFDPSTDYVEKYMPVPVVNAIFGTEESEWTATTQSLITDKFYNTENDPMPSTTSNGSGMACICVQVQEGDVFRITGSGANTAARRMWVVTDSTRTKTRSCTLNVDRRTVPEIITVSSGEAYLYVNLCAYDSTTDKVEKLTATTTETEGLIEKVDDIENTIPTITNTLGQLNTEVENTNKFMPELISGKYTKEEIEIETIVMWPYSIKTDGYYGTSATAYHTRLFVRPGDVVEMTTSSSGTRYGFLSTVSKPASGGAIDLVANTSVIAVEGNKHIAITVPEGAAAIAIYLNSSPYSSTPESITIWHTINANQGVTSISPIIADGYRPTSVIESKNDGGFMFPVIAGRTYLTSVTRVSSGTVYCSFISNLPSIDAVTGDHTSKTVTNGIYKLVPETNGFYLLSAGSTITVQVTEVSQEVETVKEGYIEEDLSAALSAALTFEEVDLHSLTIRDYNLDAIINTYGLSETYKHLLVPVTEGKYVLIKRGDSNLVYAWLTSDATPVAGDIPSYAPQTVRCYTTKEEVLLKAPQGTNFLLIYLYSGASYYPSFVGIASDEVTPTPTPEPSDDDKVAERGDGSANSKLFLNQERPYYFAQGWSNNDTIGHLDKMLSFVPEGRHFISFADIHLDYDFNFGLRQKQSTVMRYVQERLRNCSVVFLGDLIGKQASEDTAKKEMTWFADEYFGIFGSKFVPVFGDHDTDKVDGGLENGLPDKFIADTFFGPAYKYDAVEDTLGIEAIDDVTFSEDADTNATKKAAWKDYMRMHYYVDDKANKIRFISITQGAVFQDIPSRYNVPGEALYFICTAMKTAPDDYDIVVASHDFQIEKRSEVQLSTNAWDALLFEALSAFKNRTTFSLTRPYYSYDEEKNVWAAIAAKYNSASFNFSEKTGKVFAIQGDKHYDFVGYWDYNTKYTHFAVNYTPTANDILFLVQDRCALNQNQGFQSSWGSTIPAMLKAFRRAPASTSENNLIGTINEVLFDVYTINDDGLTITRFGDAPTAGKPGLYPSFDESESYSVGDRVIWYAMVGEQYAVKAYEFIVDHEPGVFNIEEVQEIIVTDPYIRNYTL